MASRQIEQTYAKHYFYKLCEEFGVDPKDANIEFPQYGRRAYYQRRGGQHKVVIPVSYINSCESTSFVPEYPQYEHLFIKYVGRPEEILPFEKVQWVVRHEFAHLLTYLLGEEEPTRDPNGYHGTNWQNNLKIVCEIQ